MPLLETSQYREFFMKTSAKQVSSNLFEFYQDTTGIFLGRSTTMNDLITPITTMMDLITPITTPLPLPPNHSTRSTTRIALRTVS